MKEMWLTHYSPSLIRPDEYMDMVREFSPMLIQAKMEKQWKLNFEED